jgi:hypothetical protein
MRAALPVLLAGLLAGCESLPSISMPDMSFLTPTPARSGEAPPPIAGASMPASARPGDALAAFAATASVGSSGVVDGQPARLARVYHAASGRECREVVVGGGMSQRALVACREADGSFVSARPLLLGGRP